MNPTEMFLKKKKDDSAFVTLANGESIRILALREIKCVVKTGYAGEEKDVLRLVCDVQTESGLKIKNFDNGSTKFAKELTEKGVLVGSSFTITRVGEQTKTVYNISEVDNSRVSKVYNAETIQQATPVAEPVKEAPAYPEFQEDTASGAPAGIINN